MVATCGPGGVVGPGRLVRVAFGRSRRIDLDQAGRILAHLQQVQAEHRRGESGGGWPGWYLPLNNPAASGK